MGPAAAQLPRSALVTSRRDDQDYKISVEDAKRLVGGRKAMADGTGQSN